MPSTFILAARPLSELAMELFNIVGRRRHGAPYFSRIEPYAKPVSPQDLRHNGGYRKNRPVNYEKKNIKVGLGRRHAEALPTFPQAYGAGPLSRTGVGVETGQIPRIEI